MTVDMRAAKDMPYVSENDAPSISGEYSSYAVWLKVKSGFRMRLVL